MAWIESHQELRNNPKTRKLARCLNVSIPAVIGHLQCLWWWATDYAQDGELSKYDNDDIADAMMWDGEPTALVDALVQVRFIDKDDNGLRIHDWWDYAGKLIERREKDRERKKTSERPRSNSTVREISVGTPTEIQRKDERPRIASGVTEQYPTEQNTTQQDRTGQNTTTTPLPPASGGAEDTAACGGEVAAVAPSDPVPYVKILDFFNKTCVRLSNIKTIDGKRKKAVSARFKTYGWEGFVTLFDKASRSEFLCGNGSKNWKADFDWLMNVDNFAKVIEGKYDVNNSPHPPPQAGQNGRPPTVGNRNGVDTMGVLDKIKNTAMEVISGYENSE